MSFRKTSLSIIKNVRSFSVLAKKPNSWREWYKELWEPKPITSPPYDHFVQVGDPVLRARAAAVPADLIESKEIDFVIAQMIKVLKKYQCVGVAAPQIGVSLRIIVMEFNEKHREKYNKEIYDSRKMSLLPLTILINPVMKITNYDKYKHPEGCMSVRGYMAETERYAEVLLTGIGKNNTPAELKLNGWNARIAQHEMDHLDGKLYIDHMDRATFSCVCWEAVNAKAGRIEIPFYK